MAVSEYSVLVKYHTSLAQLKLGLKLVFDYMGAWRMLMVPDRRFEGLCEVKH